MTYRTSPTSSLSHGRLAVMLHGGRAVIAMTAVFVLGGALLTACGRSSEATPGTVAPNGGANTLTNLPATAPAPALATAPPLPATAPAPAPALATVPPAPATAPAPALATAPPAPAPGLATAPPAPAPLKAHAVLAAAVDPKPSTPPKPAAIQYTSSVDPGEAQVSGTSTLHAWTVTSHKINGDAEFSGEQGPAPSIALESIDLTVPVDSLKSTEGSGMDNTMYDALKLKTFPAITYKLTAGSLKTLPSKEDPAYHFDTTGQLTVSGAAHIVELDIAVVPHDDGKLTITTDTKLKMSDYGVTPPTAMLGLIKSGDAITVKVTWELNRKP
jgi:polyisoprenoid-binding protein YceI